MSNTSNSIEAPSFQATVHLDGVPLQTTITTKGPLSTGGHLYHFEFESPHRQPTPMSETGYRSWFITLPTSVDAGVLEEYAHDYCEAFAQSDDSQPSLLDLCGGA